MSSLLQLPPEILQYVLLQLSWWELVQLSRCCEHLHVLVQDDRLWQHLVKTDYHISELTGTVLNTYKKLYQRLLHPYGWMIGLYWSRIDYFGGLLEIKVSGDSIVATSLRVSDEGVLVASHSFEVCVASTPTTQLCSMIERTHATQIILCQDGESLRQKCQFHDTKFAQGHYNYNTEDGFRAMTFIDAHRLGIVHYPLVLPEMSSIPRELWTTTPLNSSRCSHRCCKYCSAVSNRSQKIDALNVNQKRNNDTDSNRKVFISTENSAISLHGQASNAHSNGNSSNIDGEDMRNNGNDVIKSNDDKMSILHAIQLADRCHTNSASDFSNTSNDTNSTLNKSVKTKTITTNCEQVKYNFNDSPCNVDAVASSMSVSGNSVENISSTLNGSDDIINTCNATAVAVNKESVGATASTSLTQHSMSVDSLSSCNTVSSSSTNDSINTAASNDICNAAAVDNFALPSTSSSANNGGVDCSNNSCSAGNGSRRKVASSSSNNSISNACNSAGNDTDNTANKSSAMPLSNSMNNFRQDLVQLYRDTFCPIRTSESFGSLYTSILSTCSTRRSLCNGSSSGSCYSTSNKRSPYNPFRRKDCHECNSGIMRCCNCGSSSCDSSSRCSNCDSNSSFCRCNNGSDVPRLSLCVEPPELPPHVLKPGLYGAHYGPHGYEILMLDYKIREITLQKILGDQYVPSKEISVKISLPYSFSLTLEQQLHMTTEELEEIEPQQNKSPLSHYEQQPFRLHPSVDINPCDEQFPSTCLARYHGFGQLANLFHSQPKFTRAHIAVFSNEMFGVLFLEINSFMIFRRINRAFAKRANISKHGIVCSD